LATKQKPDLVAQYDTTVTRSDLAAPVRELSFSDQFGEGAAVRAEQLPGKRVMHSRLPRQASSPLQWRRPSLTK